MNPTTVWAFVLQLGNAPANTKVIWHFTGCGGKPLKTITATNSGSFTMEEMTYNDGLDGKIGPSPQQSYTVEEPGRTAYTQALDWSGVPDKCSATTASPKPAKQARRLKRLTHREKAQGEFWEGADKGKIVGKGGQHVRVYWQLSYCSGKGSGIWHNEVRETTAGDGVFDFAANGRNGGRYKVRNYNTHMKLSRYIHVRFFVPATSTYKAVSVVSDVCTSLGAG